jgi:hypothetical protein
MARPLRFPMFARLTATCGHGQFLYALESAKGRIKVGHTFAPRERMTQHAKKLELDGDKPARFVVVSTDKNSFNNERELLTRLSRHGQRLDDTEWFVGLPWGLTVNLVKQIAKRQVVTVL